MKKYRIKVSGGIITMVLVSVKATSSAVTNTIELFDERGDRIAKISGSNRQVIINSRVLMYDELLALYALTFDFDLHWNNIVNLKD